MSKSQTCGLWKRFTKKNDIMIFTLIDVNFDVKYDGHQNCSKTLSMHILRVFGQYCQYLSTRFRWGTGVIGHMGDQGTWAMGTWA